VAAVQGTVVDDSGTRVDGRGIALDRWALPVQVDRGARPEDEPASPRQVVAASATAAVFRGRALRQAVLANGEVFDSRFGSYHEDLDLGLRLGRLGWSAQWTPGAPCRHAGSASGLSLRWRHPWWLLANRWRALAGNLGPRALTAALPRLLRGELRAVRTLLPTNPRVCLVAVAVLCALPLLVATGWQRSTAGPRLQRLPETGP
jgi:GT2 family glycosyltransferase